ncbi:MAG TPA: formate--tetrahydrofolate ligase [Candidatus Coproplasma excrementigallinarum]|uniref:Formate--tetrahydrofolate ligase n=1 Tax=Candidatus Coproplasma excrementigallinarum TaxID=2840747 RepID=A0A9D1SIN1_9FIRM|nr:formate--tetrahydrofolate ligase [Candidatus Coproplasma excrementigallinarum]
MLSDIEIAESCVMQPITRIAAKLGLKEDDLELYGRYKAKINLKKVQPKAKLILVTAINPTASGEGKTTVSIGLADGMAKLGKKVCLALREPSLGPVFGIKGGAAGGGYAQVVPMADINLHFTGDLHAITSANNLLCAVIDNHIFRGNALKIKEVYFHRCMDMNDRALRDLTISCEAGKMKGCESYTRKERFDITAASEVMAILCLATDLADLKRRLENIVVGEDEDGNFVYAKSLNVAGAMATLLKDAIKPNLVQTLEGTPAIVHGGPFANIAHGCNSIRATYTAMTLADYAVTEAGFGADLGAEKFLDTKCRVAGIQPDCVVVVATVKALKLHGGADKNNLTEENLEALEKGLPNLLKHIENIKKVFSKPVVVAMNRFATDTPAEIEAVISACDAAGATAVFTDVFLKGGEGGRALAEKVIWMCEKKSKLTYAYNLEDDIKTKINDIVTKVYGGDGAEYSEEAERKIADIEGKGIKGLPVIIAKTQYSLSDDAKKLARPEGFKIHVRDIIYKGGANFIVAVAGDINLMPGLGKVPAAEHIDIDAEGNITGLS